MRAGRRAPEDGSLGRRESYSRGKTGPRMARSSSLGRREFPRRPSDDSSGAAPGADSHPASDRAPSTPISFPPRFAVSRSGSRARAGTTAWTKASQQPVRRRLSRERSGRDPSAAARGVTAAHAATLPCRSRDSR